VVCDQNFLKLRLLTVNNFDDRGDNLHDVVVELVSSDRRVTFGDIDADRFLLNETLIVVVPAQADGFLHLFVRAAGLLNSRSAATVELEAVV
jgi:hypothetical protein